MELNRKAFVLTLSNSSGIETFLHFTCAQQIIHKMHKVGVFGGKDFYSQEAKAGPTRNSRFCLPVTKVYYTRAKETSSGHHKVIYSNPKAYCDHNTLFNSTVREIIEGCTPSTRVWTRWSIGWVKKRLLQGLYARHGDLLDIV